MKAYQVWIVNPNNITEQTRYIVLAEDEKQAGVKVANAYHGLIGDVKEFQTHQILRAAFA